MVDPDLMSDEDKKRKKTGCAKKSKHKKDKSDDEVRKRKKHKKKLKKKARSSSESTSSADERRKHKSKKRKRLEKKSGERKRSGSDNQSDDAAMDIPIELMDTSKAMVPMTKEEYEKRQSIVRRVYDEESGRHRLIKGDGEVIEEIVSRDRHKQINKCATESDGSFFQSKLHKSLK